MKKRNILLLITLGFAILIGAAIMAFQLSLQKVEISFDASGGTTLKMYSRKGTKDPLEKQGSVVHTFKGNETITVQKGAYVIEASGNNVNQDLTALTVGDTPVKQTISVNYAPAYLLQLLQGEQTAITQAITTRYKDIQLSYSIQPGKLYGKGDWYATALTFRGLSRDNRDTLHIVLHKTDNAWKIVTKPQITLSIIENKDVPDYILRDVNAYLPVPSPAPPAPAPNYVIMDGSPGAR